jgi:hypothetical protein
LRPHDDYLLRGKIDHHEIARAGHTACVRSAEPVAEHNAVHFVLEDLPVSVEGPFKRMTRSMPCDQAGQIDLRRKTCEAGCRSGHDTLHKRHSTGNQSRVTLVPGTGSICFILHSLDAQGLRLAQATRYGTGDSTPRFVTGILGRRMLRRHRKWPANERRAGVLVNVSLRAVPLASSQLLRANGRRPNCSQFGAECQALRESGLCAPTC